MRPRRLEVLAVGILSVGFFLDLLLGARPLSPTHDELANIPSGVAHLRLGQPSDFTHPPLARYLTAIPLLLLGADPVDTPEGRSALEGWRWKDYGRLFVFHNQTLGARTIVLAARVPVMIMAVALGLVIWAWARRRYGPAGGLLALGAFSFSPSVLAHGRLCTTDMPMALFGVLAILALGRSLRLRTVGSEALTGVALGGAFLVKYSAVTLLPAAAILWLVAWWRERAAGVPTSFAKRVLRPPALAAAFCALTIWAGFGFQVRRIADEPLLRINPKAQQAEREADAILRVFGLRAKSVMSLPLPAYDFWKGLGTQVAHNFLQDQWMHDGFQYLWGRYSPTGWWYYFPLCFAWKTPLALLALFAAALWMGALSGWHQIRSARGLAARLGSSDLDAWVLGIPPLVYAVFCLTSTINIGERYLLPAYPPLFVALGRLALPIPARARPGASTSVPRWIVVTLGSALAATSLWAFPDHLSYFNALVGGSREGWRYLADSNVDWGQDVWRLRDRLAAAGVVDPYYVDVFTSARPVEDFGLFAYSRAAESKIPPDYTGLVILSANRLLFKERDTGRGLYASFASAEPLGRIGDSIFLYWAERGSPLPPLPGSAASRLADGQR